jgi:AraC family transcriptional regulator of adaptative response / DNA-3-methyladenine glycosylase II
MDFEAMYGAIAARDTRFDGQFYTAVRSTGIYCRPSCPARTPKRENTTFYPTSAAAHLAGYRACKRCAPDAVPGTPRWNVESDVAARAMRLINDGLVDRAGVPQLAATVGYSSRQLGRVLTRQLGAGPLVLARARRAQTARDLLTQTALPVADVAFSSGFSSVRAFNETIREVFDRTPGQLRSMSSTDASHTPGAISLVLPHRKPFDAPGIFAFLAARALDGVENAEATSYARTLRTPGGSARIRVWLDDSRLRLNTALTCLSDLAWVVSRVRRLFDLDADPLMVDSVLRRDPRLARSVAAAPGIRVPGAIDAEETLFRAIIGQQVSVSAARHLLRELMVTGDSVPGDDGLTRLFPSAEQIATEGHRLLRGPAAKTATMRRVAEALAAGDLRINISDERGELERRLRAIDGIGEWTSGYLAMRVLGDPDILLSSDAAIKAGAARLGITESLSAFARPFAPWRSYLGMHLWRAALLVRPAAARTSTTQRFEGTHE